MQPSPFVVPKLTFNELQAIAALRAYVTNVPKVSIHSRLESMCADHLIEGNYTIQYTQLERLHCKNTFTPYYTIIRVDRSEIILLSILNKIDNYQWKAISIIGDKDYRMSLIILHSMPNLLELRVVNPQRVGEVSIIIGLPP